MAKRREKPNLEMALADLFSNLEILPEILPSASPVQGAIIQSVLQNSLAAVSHAAAPERQYSSTGTFSALEAVGTADEPQSDKDDRKLTVLTDIKALIERRDPNYL